MKGLKLTIELIPESTWGISLANKLPKKDWDKIRLQTYREADYHCEICNAKGTMNAHEVWGFKDKEHIQYLKDIICLCEVCHSIKHFGRSQTVGEPKYIEKLIKHWCKINNKTEVDFEIYKNEVFKLCSKRSERMYQVKIGRRILKSG